MDRDKLKAHVDLNQGILKLRPAWIAHTFLKAGKRLGLPEELYNQGERGDIMERWFCSVTRTGNNLPDDDEGLSYLEIPGEKILVKEAVELLPEIIGEEYAKNHNGLDVLVKLFDFGCRLFLHYHPEKKWVGPQGKNPKDEAYYFMDAPPGPHPETFFGVHPHIVRDNLQYEIFEPILKEWKAGDAEVLKHSRAYYCTPGEGFFIKSGILHAPGSVLTLEIQESSDVGVILQPRVEDHPIDKSMLFKDVSEQDQQKYGPERAALVQVDWEACSDPDFYEKTHLYPKKAFHDEENGIYEDWIFYGSTKFSGKRLRIAPGGKYFSKERGVHNIFVWKGEAKIGHASVKAGDMGLDYCNDELLICHARAVEGYPIENTGDEYLEMFKFFGPDINNGITPEIG